MGKFNRLNKYLKAAVVAALAVVVLSVVGLLLAVFGVFSVDPIKLCALVLTLGLALVFIVYGLMVKGGYETAVGLLLAMIGLTVLLVPVLKWYTVIVDLLFGIAAVLALMLLKSDALTVKRAEDEPNVKTYEDVRREKLEKQAEEEAKPLPEIKNYNKEDKSI